MDIPKIINELYLAEAQASEFQKTCQRIREALQPMSMGRSKKGNQFADLEARFLAKREKTRRKSLN